MKTLTVLALAFVALIAAHGADKPEYLDSFNSRKGFKPAQRDLTEVFLQLAGSLEEFGSPEPYLRHVAQEHARIESLYRRKFSTEPKSYRPGYMTDEYIDRLATNWNLLSPKLGLEAYAKEVGHMMRDAIKGTRGTGTIIVEIFNRHQDRVLDSMTGTGRQGADFEALRAELVTRLELDKKTVDEGGYEVARRDAVRCAIIIHGVTMKLFVKLEQGLKPADAQRVKTIITSIFMDVGATAQSELQAGTSALGFEKLSAVAK